MNKKLMAVAVAGALAAPALAFAQASTVQLYGKITYEYGVSSQSGRPNVDYADSPGGTAIGFKGEEKLGGGLSAWFQCETSADVRGYDQIGLCSRNSAIGLKGAFGNVHFGRWDTPMKRALNVGTVGATETGLLGMSFVAFGGSGGADATGTAGGAVVSGESQQRGRWKRREAGLSYYESPNFSGFQVLAAFSPGNAATDNAVLDGAVNAKPRVQSISAIYSNGPIGIGLGYEKHKEFGASTAAADLDDRAWGLSGAYTFGAVKVGATYLDTSYNTAPGKSLDKKTWTLGVEWKIAGPHGLEAQYARAGDSKGNSTTAVQRNDVSGANTGAKDWSVAYTYAFSKRTDLRLGYHRTSNDSGTKKYALGNTGGAVNNGDSSSAYAMYVQHRF